MADLAHHHRDRTYPGSGLRPPQDDGADAPAPDIRRTDAWTVVRYLSSRDDPDDDTTPTTAMATIPQHLRDRLRDAKVIPFVGAGVSMAVRRTDGTALFPSWKELLERGANRLDEESKTTPAQAVRKLLAGADHLAAAECLRENLGTLWTPFLRDQLDPRHEDADDHSLALARTIWALGSKLILTTNFDCVLHWTCPEPHVCAFWDVASAAEKAQLLAGGTVRKPTIWHLHGRIDNAANLVLTPELYNRLYAPDSDDASGHRAARETLRQGRACFEC